MATLQSSEVYAKDVANASSVEEVVEVVQRAMEAPSVFFFASLLHALHAHPLVKGADSASEVVSGWTSVVELLAYKTVCDIDASPAGVKALLTAHPIILHKLRMLSLLTLCGQQSMTVRGICLSYDVVAHATAVKGSMEVQRVVLAAVQASLCVARLDERAATVRVYAFESREVQADEVAALKRQIAEWTEHTKAQLRDMP